MVYALGSCSGTRSTLDYFRFLAPLLYFQTKHILFPILLLNNETKTLFYRLIYNNLSCVNYLNKSQNMFYFRLDRLFIKDNGRNTIFKSRDLADIQVYSFISTEDTVLPSITGLTTAKTEEEKLDLIKKATNEFISVRSLPLVQRIKDNHELTFGDTGTILYRSEKIPSDLHWQLVVVGSREKQRSKAKIYNDVINSSDFNNFSKSLLTALSIAVTPQITASIAIGKFVTNFILQQYAKKEDDQLGLIYQSWIRRTDYPHGKRTRDHQIDLRKNMFYDYTIFGFEN